MGRVDISTDTWIKMDGMELTFVILLGLTAVRAALHVLLGWG